MTQGRRIFAVVLGLLLSAEAFAKTYVLQDGPKTAGPSVQREESVRGSERLIALRFNLRALDTTAVKAAGQEFQKVAVDDLALSSDVGAPALPFYALTLPIAASELVVEVKPGQAVPVAALRVYPAQPEKCRCPDDKTREFVQTPVTFRTPQAFYRVESLGDFRGTPVSRVVVFPQQYDASTQALVAYPRLELSIRLNRADTVESLIRNSVAKGSRAASAYDFLIIAPRSFQRAVEPWALWKTSTRGLRFKMMALEDIGANTASLTTTIRNEYRDSNFTYALIVGNQNVVPAHRVQTSGSSQTPSDLPYFAMGGTSDIIPDVFAGRLVVSTPEQAQKQLSRFRAYEEDGFESPNGWARALGVASNEGSGPSDNEYVLSIQNKIAGAFNTEFDHFYENSANSNPREFNQAMNRGAMWTTYMGHGSGTSWPSFGQEYDVTDIKDLDNSGQVKAIWIDVACQNGRLEQGFAGERMMNEVDAKGAPIGLSAYYGGSVNISWHPPAILARGMAFRMADNAELRTLGAIIQAGHVYLSENYSGASELAYNQRWYHLQGDPSMQVRLTQ
ncbi:MAG: hypothetical protein IT285_02880 [Bdellovibrionales bacterium]|nr:hypothetical protein [Bdellovibrionales bacterium]